MKPICKAAMLAAFLVLASPRMASAQTTYTWNGATSAWATGSNWVGGVVPGSKTLTTNNDIAQFGSVGSNSSIGLDFSVLGSNYYLGTIQLASTDTKNAHLREQ